MADEAEGRDELARERKRDAGDVAAEEGPAALAAELDRLDEPPQTPATKEAAPGGDEAQVGNWYWRAASDEHPEGCAVALPMPAILKCVDQACGGWPKGMGAKNPIAFGLNTDGTIRYLTDPAVLFGWLGERTGRPVKWKGGSDESGNSFFTKEEAYNSIRENSERFEGATEYPFEPPLPRVFCNWMPPEHYKPEGKFFEELLNFFDNYDTEEDRVLIRALFMTPAWGGVEGYQYGCRPCFPITAPDKRCGKSMLGTAVSMLYGGHILHTMGQRDDQELFSRLLTKDALPKRVVLVDNAKGAISSANMECAITMDQLSGKLIYHGEATRPNNLSWIITANGLRLSRDMAGRSFIVRVKRPVPKRNWVGGMRSFIQANRQRILADIVAELRKPALEVDATDAGGWDAWIAGVLCRATPDPAMVLRVLGLNSLRRSERDEDLSEAEDIMEEIHAFTREKPAVGADAESLLADIQRANGATDFAANLFDELAQVFVPSACMASILERAIHMKPNSLKKKGAANIIAEHAEAGRVVGVVKAGEHGTKRKSNTKGYWIDRAAVRAWVEARNQAETEPGGAA